MPTRLHTRQLHKDFPVSRKRGDRSHTIRLSFFNAFSTVSDQVLSEFLSNQKTCHNQKAHKGSCRRRT
jgi:hypothetical protein